MHSAAGYILSAKVHVQKINAVVKVGIAAIEKIAKNASVPFEDEQDTSLMWLLAGGFGAAEWNAIVHEWSVEHTTAEAVRLASELRIPVAPVHNGADIFGGRENSLFGRFDDRDRVYVELRRWF